jgi:hypothetical protein
MGSRRVLKTELFCFAFYLSLFFTGFYMYNWFGAFFTEDKMVLFTINEYGEMYPELIIMIAVIIIEIIGVWSLYGLSKDCNEDTGKRSCDDNVAVLDTEGDV